MLLNFQSIALLWHTPASDRIHVGPIILHNMPRVCLTPFCPLSSFDDYSNTPQANKSCIMSLRKLFRSATHSIRVFSKLVSSCIGKKPRHGLSLPPPPPKKCKNVKTIKPGTYIAYSIIHWVKLFWVWNITIEFSPIPSATPPPPLEQIHAYATGRV